MSIVLGLRYWLKMNVWDVSSPVRYFHTVGAERCYLQYWYCCDLYNRDGVDLASQCVQ